MRIISGKYGGRKFHPPNEMPYTRPTTDMAKEGLFNILHNRIALDGIDTLDLFGGTGNISYELASRGAAKLTIIEKDPTMFQFIKKNMDALGVEGVQIIRMDVFAYISQCEDTYDFIFAGPPYALNTIDDLPLRIMEKKILNEGGLFVLEHTPRNKYEGYAGFVQERNYGTTVFSFFENIPEE